jgi:hypothetical protein
MKKRKECFVTGIKVLAVSKALQHSSGRNNSIFLSFVYFSNSKLKIDIHAFISMKIGRHNLI